MSFTHGMQKPRFHIKGFALYLVLKLRLGATHKWPVQ